MKKFMTILAIVVLFVGTMSVTAPAYCGRGNGCGMQQQQYDVCTVDGCDTIGLHEHDGVYYYCAYRETGRGCGKGRWR